VIAAMKGNGPPLNQYFYKKRSGTPETRSAPTVIARSTDIKISEQECTQVVFPDDCQRASEEELAEATNVAENEL
jgi:hypothetical protein